MLKKILILTLVILVFIQFFRPAKNHSTGPQSNGIETKYIVPDDVMGILQKTCYDCHSNNTRYLWYHHIQPIAWWLAQHVTDGKKELNFDEFTNTPIRRQYHKLEEINEQIREGEMPLKSYTIIHKDAILTDAEKNAVYAWVDATRATIETRYPKDSLERAKGPIPGK